MLSLDAITFIFNFIHVGFRVYYVLLMANILLTWFPMVRGNSITVFIYEMTEPYLRFFRRLWPPTPRFPVDFSPILAIFALYILENVTFRLLVFLL